MFSCEELSIEGHSSKSQPLFVTLQIRYGADGSLKDRDGKQPFECIPESEFLQRSIIPFDTGMCICEYSVVCLMQLQFHVYVHLQLV